MPSLLRGWERFTSGATHASFGRPTTRASQNTKRDAGSPSLTATTVVPPSRRERIETAAVVKSYTQMVTAGGLPKPSSKPEQHWGRRDTAHYPRRDPTHPPLTAPPPLR